jgi:hypothetical protein
MTDVPAQIQALNTLLKSRLAANQPSEFERRISKAQRVLKHAVVELRNAVQVNPCALSFKMSPHDPRIQSALAQDIAAELILRIAAEFLPKSERLRAAAKVMHAQRRADGKRAVGESEINDTEALIQMGRLIIKSGGEKRPKTAARDVAGRASGNSVDAIVTRLWRKYTANGQLYEALAAAHMRQEALTEARQQLNMRDEEQVDAFCRGNEELASLVEKIKENAETARLVKLLTES